MRRDHTDDPGEEDWCLLKKRAAHKRDWGHLPSLLLTIHKVIKIAKTESPVREGKSPLEENKPCVLSLTLGNSLSLRFYTKDQ